MEWHLPFTVSGKPWRGTLFLGSLIGTDARERASGDEEPSDHSRPRIGLTLEDLGRSSDVSLPLVRKPVIGIFLRLPANDVKSEPDSTE